MRKGHLHLLGQVIQNYYHLSAFELPYPPVFISDVKNYKENTDIDFPLKFASESQGALHL